MLKLQFEHNMKLCLKLAGSFFEDFVAFHVSVLTSMKKFPIKNSDFLITLELDYLYFTSVTSYACRL